MGRNYKGGTEGGLIQSKKTISESKEGDEGSLISTDKQSYTKINTNKLVKDRGVNLKVEDTDVF